MARTSHGIPRFNTLHFQKQPANSSLSAGHFLFPISDTLPDSSKIAPQQFQGILFCLPGIL